MEKLNIPVELCGHKGRIVHLWGQVASPALLTEDDFLTIYVEFDEPPEGLLGTCISIPAKEYSREELLTIFKSEGEKHVAETITNLKKEHEESALRQQKGERVAALVKRTAKILQAG